MGSRIGHVLPGSGFFLIGLWHLINHIKLNISQSKTYTTFPWFPTSRFRYLELSTIIGGCLLSISFELFIGPKRHQPLDLDGTIPSYHLRNLEHANISLSFLIYAVFSIIIDKIRPPSKHALTLLLASIAFGQELFLFHLHSTDRMGIEGQYHFLLQVVILITFLTTLLSIGYPRSFLISFVRSVSVLFHGIWMTVMGVMLWTPTLIPKGCFLNSEDGHRIVRCRDIESLGRAKSLVNILFSWYVVGVTIFAVSVYLGMVVTARRRTGMFVAGGGKVGYEHVNKFDFVEEENNY